MHDETYEQGKEITAQEGQPQKLTFSEILQIMPKTLMQQVIKRLGTAILLAVIITVMVFTAKDWSWCIGYTLVLFVAYLGLDIIWKFAEGKIYTARMIVCKAQRSRKNDMTVILRDASIENVAVQEVETFKYVLSASVKEKNSITPGTVLDIYVSETAPHNILAFELLGELGK